MTAQPPIESTTTQENTNSLTLSHSPVVFVGQRRLMDASLRQARSNTLPGARLAQHLPTPIAATAILQITHGVSTHTHKKTLN